MVLEYLGQHAQLLEMLAQGRSQREIAKDMNISSPELKKRLRALYRMILTGSSLIPKSPTTGTSQCRTVGLGLPCAKCRIYYAADLDICPNCKSPERVGYATEPDNLNPIAAVAATSLLAGEVMPEIHQPIAHYEVGSHNMSAEASRLAPERVGYTTEPDNLNPIAAVAATSLLAGEVMPEIHQPIAHYEVGSHNMSTEASRLAPERVGYTTEPDNLNPIAAMAATNLLAGEVTPHPSQRSYELRLHPPFPFLALWKRIHQFVVLRS